MTNGGRGDQTDGPQGQHRRVNPDELTPDDLFRPEPPQVYQQPGGRHQVYTPIPVEDLPEPGEPWPSQSREPAAERLPGGGDAVPRQGEPWGSITVPAFPVPGTGSYQGAPPGPPSAPGGAPDASAETQLITPYGASGSQDPEGARAARPVPVADDAEETRPIPQIPQSEAGVSSGPVPPPWLPAAGSAQYSIRPGVPGEPHDGEPPYSDPAGARSQVEPDPAPGDAGATRLLPPVSDGGAHPPPAPAADTGLPPAVRGRGRRRAQGTATPSERPVPGSRGRRAAAPGSFTSRFSPAGLAALVVAGCAVVGLITGAVLSGDDDGEQEAAPQKAAATSSAPTSPAAPAQRQAKALDALLKDSNSSRSAVISAVDQIRRCRNLDGAARSLRDAAARRGELISRLAGLSVDRLAGHQQLSASLNKAWASSASADNHYASWADDMAHRKHGCRKGQARVTRHAQLANRASGEATAAKQRAAPLWNAIARRYGLTEHKATDL